MKPEQLVNKLYYLPVSIYAAPAVNVDIANVHGCNKEVHCELLSRKTKVRLY